MSLSCPERIAAAIPAEVRASRIARARTFAAVHESGSDPLRKLVLHHSGANLYGRPLALSGLFSLCDVRPLAAC